MKKKMRANILQVNLGLNKPFGSVGGQKHTFDPNLKLVLRGP